MIVELQERIAWDRAPADQSQGVPGRRPAGTRAAGDLHPAERTLIGQGETESIQHIRHRFQHAMADQFKAIVEQATGRRVRSFMSETDVEQDISVEIFVLGENRTDMGGFEAPGE